MWTFKLVSNGLQAGHCDSPWENVLVYAVKQPQNDS